MQKSSRKSVKELEKIKQVKNIEAPQKLTFKERIIISSDSKVKSVFDVFILLLVGYSCATNIYYVAFGTPTSPITLTVNHIIEAFFYMDFFLNFF